MINLFVLLYFRYTEHHGSTHVVGIFHVQCSLTWAALQQPYITKILSSPPPQNKNNWVHSVIFEPQPKIQLT